MQTSHTTDPADTSYLFLVRLWRQAQQLAYDEQSIEGQEWHGKVQHLKSGQAHRFDGLPALQRQLQSLLRELEERHGQITGDETPEL